jgi:nitrite reductase/ring-hydroxylating ferredoxin subunit
MAKYVVASAGEIPSGGRKIVEVGGVSVGIFNLGGEFFALRNRCPHQGGPLCEGKVWGILESTAPGQIQYSRPGEMLACSWHGWEFDIRTGQSWCDPRRLRTRRFPVSVESGATLVAEEEEESTEERVRGPYVADTFPVTQDGSYVVVEIAE